MSDTYDVTIRVSVEFESAAEMAGWLERTVVNEMEKQDWMGGCVVIFRGEDNHMMMFQDGQGASQGGFILPHGLYQMDDREDEPYVPLRESAKA